MPAVPTPAGGPIGTTTAELIEETRTRILSGQEERLNRLSGPIDIDDTNISAKYPVEGVTRGSIVAVDLEEIRVWENTSSVLSLVERAVNGSTPAAHVDQAVMTIGPKFSPFRILRAMNEELAALSSPANGLFQMKQVELTWMPAAAGYDLVGVTSIDDIWQVEAKVSSAATKDWRPIEGWRLNRAANLTDFPSGFGLSLFETGMAGQPLRVWYRAPFTALSKTDITFDVGLTGLPETAVELLPLGAMLRLVPPRDIKRTFTEAQGQPRRAEEVPPNTASQSVSSLRQWRKDRIAEEAARLTRLYPRRHRRSA